MIGGYQGINLTRRVRHIASSALLFALAGCASTKEGGQAFKLDQVVQDQGSWALDLDFATESPAATPAPSSTPAARLPLRGQPPPREQLRFDPNNPGPFLAGLAEQGLLLHAHVSGKLPTTTTTGAAESSWFQRTFHLGLSLWTKILIALGLLAAGLLAWRFRGGLAGVALKLIGK